MNESPTESTEAPEAPEATEAKVAEAEIPPPGAPLDANRFLHRHGLKRLLPSGLFGRSLALLIVPLLLAQGFFFVMFYERLYQELTFRSAENLGDEIRFALIALESEPQDSERAILLSRLEQTLSLKLRFPDAAFDDSLAPALATTPKGETDWRADLPVSTGLTEVLRQRLGVEQAEAVRSPDNRQLTFTFTGSFTGLTDNRFGQVQATVPRKRLLSSTWYVITILVLFISLLLVVLTTLMLRNQVRAMRRLTEVANRFDRNFEVRAFTPSGAKEVREVGVAFLRMRDRLRYQMRQRDAFLAGVGHDLRTPLARLRYGLAVLPESRERETLESDAEEIDRLIHTYLRYVRGSESEGFADISFGEVLRDVLHQLSGLHPEIMRSSVCPPDMAGRLRPQATRRCLRNLIQNALNFAASRVRVQVRYLSPERAEITIEDDGPGIAEEDYARLLRPFFSLTPVAADADPDEEPSQSSDDMDEADSASISTVDPLTGPRPAPSMGMGLAIAHDLAISQGGSLALSRSEELGGLIVRLRLPVSKPER